MSLTRAILTGFGRGGVGSLCGRVRPDPLWYDTLYLSERIAVLMRHGIVSHVHLRVLQPANEDDVRSS